MSARTVAFRVDGITDDAHMGSIIEAIEERDCEVVASATVGPDYILPATARRAGFVLADVMAQSWRDAAEHFTCSEADGIALTLRLLGQGARAVEVVLAHAHADEEGDEHYHLAFAEDEEAWPDSKAREFAAEYVDQLDNDPDTERQEP